MDTQQSLFLITCLLFPCINRVGGSLFLEPSQGNASLGGHFKFTLRVTESNVTSRLVIFQRANSTNICTLVISTGKQFRKETGYDCGLKQNNQTFFLQIHNVSVEDAGSWFGQIAGMKSNAAKLNVRYPPTVKIEPGAPCKGFTHTENETNVSLNCTVISANPVPSTFQWYHNNQSLSEGQTLVIPTVIRSTGGLYRCVAYNGVSPPGEHTVTVNVHYPPKVTVPNTTIIVNESRDLYTFCTADANPNVTSLVLTKKGAQHYAQLPASNGVLGLRNLTKNDTGTYICTATNTVTKCDNTTEDKRVMAEVKVEVQYKPTIMSFAIFSTKGKKRVIVKEKTNVTFLCQVDSLPGADITIRKEGEKRNNTQKDSSLSVVLGSVGCQDTGNYTCSARNIVGEVESETIELLVTSKPETPLNLEVFNPTTRSLSFSWEKGFNGGAMQNFTVEYRQEGGYWITHPIMLSEEEDLQLYIHDLQPDTPYEIRLKAQNEYGSSPMVFVKARTISDIQDRLGTGVGIGMTAMLVAVGIVLVIIFRRKVAACFSVKKSNEGSVSFQASGGDDSYESGYDMPGNKYEDLQQRTEEAPKTYEELRTYQNIKSFL